MRESIRSLAATVGWNFPATRLLASRRPVILVYHGVPKRGSGITGAIFERQVAFLQQRFDLVSWEQLDEVRSARHKVQVALTFDDGFRNNAEVVAPILRRYGIPAVFFVSSRHAMEGRYLWFSYLRALDKHFLQDGFVFRGRALDMTPPKRRTTLAELWSQLVNLRPHPAAMYRAIEEECPRLEDFVPEADLLDRWAGMSDEQVKELAADPLFTIGIHTVDHPNLTKCEKSETHRQIAENKAWIERLAGRSCDLIAYPLGEYNSDVLDTCRQLKIRYGFSVYRRVAGEARLQLFRVGIYGHSLDEVGCKVRWGHLITHMQSQGYLLSH